jgi:Putative Flp pilus-assembly TadE/G-like
MKRSHSNRQSGQIIVLFVIALVAMFAMAGLLFDGGQALAMRRQLQDAGDAAALAAANVVQSGSPTGCSATPGPPPLAARQAVIDAAVAAVHVSLPNFPTASISVTCVADPAWTNFAVDVSLDGRSAGYFGGVVGMNGFAIRTTSQAVNGQIASAKYSVVELDPGHYVSPNAWAGGIDGCPSVSFAGSNTVTFDGALQVNSSCNTSNGAIAVNGNSATVHFNNGAGAFVVGTQASSPNPVSPITTGGGPGGTVAPVKDPLLKLPQIPYATWVAPLTTRAANNSASQVLEPGIYVGGIQLKNSQVAYLHPGIYVMMDAGNGDGGFQIGSGNKVYSLPTALTTTTDLTWATDCAATNCGVLIYDVGQACAASAQPKDQFSVGAGATLKLRPYVSTADGTGTNDTAYNNLLLWQDKSPTPTASCTQPPIALGGGGQIAISGTLYAPTALVQMSGNSGGSGGSSLAVTLQFISWDLSFNGGISFQFQYQSNAFAKPLDYGLIK